VGATLLFGMSVWGEQATVPASVKADGSGVAVASSSPNPTANQTSQKASWWLRHKAKRAFLAGARAMERKDPWAAETYFLHAHELDPANPNYSLSAEVARQFLVTQLVRQAEEEKILGNNRDSLSALEQAMRLDPNSPVVTAYVDTLATNVYVTPRMVPRKEEAAAPIKLTPERVRQTFHMRTDIPRLIRQVLSAYGIQATIDASVRTQTIEFNVADVDFSEATNLLALATNAFLVPLDPRRVVVVADTKENRKAYERQVTETIYLPGLSSSELDVMGNIVRGVFGITVTATEPSQSTLTVRAPELALAALNLTCMEMLTGRSELQLDVRMYEIDRTRTTNVGVVLPNSITAFNIPSELSNVLANNASLIEQLLTSNPALAGNYAAILAALIASGELTGTVFNNPFAVFGGGLTETGVEWNSTGANMLLSSSDIRLLDQIQVRVLDQEEATIRSGERYPIMTSSFSSLVGSSSSTRPIPQVQYQDLGLTLKVKPHFEGETELALNLNMKVTSLAGSSINDIPVLNNREFSGTISVHLGDGALVVSDMSKQDSLEITGVPGLSDIPGLQDATNRQDTTDSMELAIVITPHVIRLAHRKSVEPMLLLPQRDGR
jgi:general secretion pathway protein D